MTLSVMEIVGVEIERKKERRVLEDEETGPGLEKIYSATTDGSGRACEYSCLGWQWYSSMWYQCERIHCLLVCRGG